MCKEECAGAYPELVKVSPTHSVSCYLYKENAEVKSDGKNK
jgi:hypothetical protein